MVSERVGYRRLYDAVDCSISPRSELHVNFLLDKLFQVEINIGSKPRFGIIIENDEDNYLHPDDEKNVNLSYHGDATQSTYPRKFFTEICCFQDIEVDESLAKAFHHKEPKARDVLLSLAEENGEQYRRIIDLIAGTVGLKFHRQFVMKQINENFVVLRDTSFGVDVISTPFERLRDVALSDIGIRQMEAFAGLLTESDRGNTKKRQKHGVILSWLLRSWAEQDNISKFNALFIALEMVLENIKGEVPQERQSLAANVRTLILNYGGEKQKVLTKFFDDLVSNQRPTLPSRFRLLADKANMPTRESDIRAFARFTKIRNALIHQGEDDIQLSFENSTVDDKDLLGFEDIVERYISYIIYGDANIYQSHWRIKPIEISHIRAHVKMDQDYIR